jgi:short-subunit dehydrogenase
MDDKVALVTGASSGIGYELAKELANRGYDLVVASAGERLSRAAEEIRRNGHQVLEVNADLATREGVNQLREQVESLGRPVDIACINAGVGVGGLFGETNLEAELNMIELTVPEQFNWRSSSYVK